MKVNGKKIAASIAGPDGGYAMFDAREVSPKGAFLAGNLFLEVNEEFTVELAFADSSSMRVQARVDRVHRDAEPGMAVSFAGLSDSERKQLADKLGA